MKLTTEQFEALKPYEEYFRTAVNAQWARHPGRSALELIHEIYQSATKTTTRLNLGCNHCILRLLTDTGRMYFADKEERSKVEVAFKESLIPVPVKVAVKTDKPKRKYNRKQK